MLFLNMFFFDKLKVDNSKLVSKVSFNSTRLRNDYKWLNTSQYFFNLK